MATTKEELGAVAGIVIAYYGLKKHYQHLMTSYSDAEMKLLTQMEELIKECFGSKTLAEHADHFKVDEEEKTPLQKTSINWTEYANKLKHRRRKYPTAFGNICNDIGKYLHERKRNSAKFTFPGDFVEKLFQFILDFTDVIISQLDDNPNQLAALGKMQKFLKRMLTTPGLLPPKRFTVFKKLTKEGTLQKIYIQYNTLIKKAASDIRKRSLNSIIANTKVNVQKVLSEISEYIFFMRKMDLSKASYGDKEVYTRNSSEYEKVRSSKTGKFLLCLEAVRRSLDAHSAEEAEAILQSEPGLKEFFNAQYDVIEFRVDAKDFEDLPDWFEPPKTKSKGKNDTGAQDIREMFLRTMQLIVSDTIKVCNILPALSSLEQLCQSCGVNWAKRKEHKRAIEVTLATLEHYLSRIWSLVKILDEKLSANLLAAANSDQNYSRACVESDYFLDIIDENILPDIAAFRDVLNKPWSKHNDATMEAKFYKQVQHIIAMVSQQKSRIEVLLNKEVDGVVDELSRPLSIGGNSELFHLVRSEPIQGRLRMSVTNRQLQVDEDTVAAQLGLGATTLEEKLVQHVGGLPSQHTDAQEIMRQRNRRRLALPEEGVFIRNFVHFGNAVSIDQMQEQSSEEKALYSKSSWDFSGSYDEWCDWLFRCYTLTADQVNDKTDWQRTVREDLQTLDDSYSAKKTYDSLKDKYERDVSSMSLEDAAKFEKANDILLKDSSSRIRRTKLALREAETTLRNILQASRPAWRWQFGWPILQSAGWPFNSKARKHANKFEKNLDSVFSVHKKNVDTLQSFVIKFKTNTSVHSEAYRRLHTRSQIVLESQVSHEIVARSGASSSGNSSPTNDQANQVVDQDEVFKKTVKAFRKKVNKEIVPLLEQQSSDVQSYATPYKPTVQLVLSWMSDRNNVSMLAKGKHLAEKYGSTFDGKLTTLLKTFSAYCRPYSPTSAVRKAADEMFKLYSDRTTETTGKQLKVESILSLASQARSSQAS